MNVYTYVGMYVCMYVRTYVCVHVHTHTEAVALPRKMLSWPQPTPVHGAVRRKPTERTDSHSMEPSTNPKP